ncbi:Uncharacterised protein [Mycobacteroides abscessus subsp. abscessus]|uniref:hypothetical protein n=1 Tax=Mycobacteroides abscessus TaxID=36809 RepID=UPI00092B1C2C|nr:hypothetical protein [Mycobacteroides abscessus]SIJ21457.1 Uncharacterised protein [Mycobacteroides abscessus subsp. abscessus]SLH39020.1 Uncharacterised protein [Mycobacteroides abscessus subsp. abscessus]
MTLEFNTDEVFEISRAVNGVADSLATTELPVGFQPAAPDTASSDTATALSTQAATILTTLNRRIASLRGFARFLLESIDTQTESDYGHTGLTGSGPGTHGSVAGPNVHINEQFAIDPQTHIGQPIQDPHTLVELLRAGPGPRSPETFADAWATYQTPLRDAMTTLSRVAEGLQIAYRSQVGRAIMTKFDEIYLSLSDQQKAIDDLRAETAAHAEYVRQQINREDI